MVSERPGLVPYFGYLKSVEAIDFLVRAFGFVVSARVDGDDGEVIHAELQFGGSVMMLGQGEDLQRKSGVEQQPATRGVYCVVQDVDALFERATKAGAHVVYGPEDTEWGTRRCRLLDIEGYEWTFGTYAPSTDSEN